MVARSPAEFLVAVCSHRLAHVALDERQLRRVRAALADGGVLLVGEPHGTQETPAVLYALLNAFDVKTLAFERSHEEMDDVVQSFQQAGSFDFEAMWALPPSAEFFCGDGRITAGHFALLQRLRREERLDRVILFDRLDPDPAPDDWRLRDREMAERLLEEWDGHGVALVAVGPSMLSLKNRGRWRTNSPRHARVCSALIDYAAGSCWSRGETHEIMEKTAKSAIRLDVPIATPVVVPGLGAS